MTGNKIDIGSKPETAANDIPWYVTDSTRFMERFDWKPEKNVRDIVEDIFNWMKNNEEVVSRVFNK